MKFNSSKLEKGIKVNKSLCQPNLTTFKLNKDKPIHRWYYFKEGFSSDLVKNLIEEFSVGYSDKIVDCFSGSSTTVLTAQQLGIQSVGIEINPFFRFMSRVKVNNGYEVDLIKEYKEQIFREGNLLEKLPFSRFLFKEKERDDIPKLSSFKLCFSKKNLFELLKFKNYILEIDDIKYRRLFLLALASVLEKTSKVKKDGKGLKFIEKQPQKVSILLEQKINEITSDIEWKHKNNINDKFGEIFNGDARNPDFPDNSFNFAIFSPSYLNSFDYTEVYKLELWFLDFVKNHEEFRQLSNSTLRSHLSANFDKENKFENRILSDLIEVLSRKILWNKNIPDMVRSYFNDMKSVFESLNKVLKDNAYCIVVVGNSAYGKIPIPTDLLLGRLAEEVGFSFKELRIMRTLKTSSQQMDKLENKRFLRESLVILQNVK